MGRTQAKAPTPGGPSRRWPLVQRTLIRLGVIVAAALVIGTILHRVAGRVDGDGTGEGNRNPLPPAGFLQGVAQGALMPLALPNLLVGRDVPIYAARNTGRSYKLGYTVGVNGCGLIFFGLLFWRLSRLRRRLEARATSGPTVPPGAVE